MYGGSGASPSWSSSASGPTPSGVASASRTAPPGKTATTRAATGPKSSSRPTASLPRAFTSAVGAPSQEQRLGAPAAALPAAQLGRHHARVVHDEQVLGARRVRQLREAQLGERAGPALQHQEPRRVAGRARLLRDPLGRQRVV